LFPHETKAGHFLWPILYILLGGGLIVYWPTPETAWWVGGLVWIVALGMMLWLISVSVLQNVRQVLDAETERYETIMRMSHEDRVHFKLPTAKENVKVDMRISETNWAFRWISLDPERLKKFAYESLNGRPFSVRAWTGTGRLMSEGEFNNLRDDFLGAGCALPRSEKDDRQGFEWTDKGLKVLSEIVGVSQ